MITNFTVGPAKLYHGVKQYLIDIIEQDYAEISHRSPQFSAVSEQTIAAVRDFFEIPDDYRIYYLASSTEAWDVVARGMIDETSTHIVNGNFGKTWFNNTLKAKKMATKLSTDDPRQRFPVEEIVTNNSDFLAITGNETSTGIAYTPAEIAQIRQQNPDTLIGVDVTSSFGAVAYNWTQADVWHTSVQKALGMPAGLGLLIVSPRAFAKVEERYERGEDIGTHHSILGLERKMAGKFQTPTTPNFLDIATLGFVTTQLQKNFGTIHKLDVLTAEKAALIYDALEQNTELASAININNGRSVTTIVADATEEYLIDMHARLALQEIKVGTGYGSMKKHQVRIANFPVHGKEDLENLFEAIE